MYSFPDLEPVCCSMSNSNCFFLTCIQISQEAGQVAWYSHLLKNFPQLVVIHTVTCFGIVNKAKVDFFFFLELSCFFDDPAGITTLFIYFPSPSPSSSLSYYSSSFYFPLRVAKYTQKRHTKWFFKNWKINSLGKHRQSKTVAIKTISF